MTLKRAVIYLRTGPDCDEEVQRDQCMRTVIECRYELVGISTDGPDEASGWLALVQMIQRGDADLVVVAPGALPLPSAVTVQVAGSDCGDGGPPAQRRPRLLK